MAKGKKKQGRGDAAEDESPQTVPANPPRPRRVLLLTSIVLLAAWLVFLFCVARFG